MSSLYSRHPSTASPSTDWEFNKFKHLVNERDVRVGLNSAGYTLLSLTLKGVIPRNLEEGGKNPENYETYKEVFSGDLVFCQFDYDVTPRTVGIVMEKGMVTGAYTILKPRTNIDIRFLYYFFLSLDFKKDLLYLCTGLRNTLSDNVLFELEIPTPPKTIQKKIADFLDRKVTKIDSAIAKKKKLFELLEEKRTSSISHALNKELSKVKTTIKPLKTVTKVNAKTLTESTKPTMEIRYIDISSVDSKGFNGSYQRFTYGEAPSRAKRLLSSGSTIIATVRTYLKAVAYFDKPDNDIVVSTGFAVLDPTSEVHPKFLYYCVASDNFVQKVEAKSVGVSYPAINPTDLGALQISLPISRNIQKEIVNKLDLLTKKIEQAKEKLGCSIQFLEEYKKSLISNAVTGRVKI